MGTDEEAHRTLETMQDRLGRGPNVALGVGPNPSPEELRSAFLTLTKAYHPARFGRMSNELQKLANEVFLQIRAAHDLLRANQPPPRTTTSPGMPVVKPAPRVTVGTTVGMPPIARTPVAVGTQRVPRDVTKPLPVVPDTREPAPRDRPSGPIPVLKRPDPGAKTPPLELARPTGPRRPTTQGPPIASRDEAFPRVETKPGTGQIPLGRMDPATTMPPAPSVTVALDLLAQQQWDAAKIALSALSAMAPDSRHVRALMAFAAGRQAQIERRLDDARVELQRALQLDPDLAVAKTALGELFSRKK